MDAKTRNRKIAVYENAARRESQHGTMAVQPGNATSQIIHLAYCKSAAGTGTTLTAYLDIEYGREIEVNFIIHTPSGSGGDLNASIWQNLKAGSKILVVFVAGKWYALGHGISSQECDT